MNRAACILAAITHEIDQQKRWLDSLTILQEVNFCIKFDRKTKQVRFVHMTVDTEREVEGKAA